MLDQTRLTAALMGIRYPLIVVLQKFLFWTNDKKGTLSAAAGACLIGRLGRYRSLRVISVIMKIGCLDLAQIRAGDDNY
jgi:hypothetical protein